MNNQKMGVIQALGLGYEAVMRALWVILIPIGLDFYFWLGPRLSIHPLFERLIASLQPTTPLAPELQQSLDDIRRFLSEVGNSFNLFSLLATDFIGMRLLPVPTLKAFELPQSSDGSSIQPAVANLISLDSLSVVILLALALLVLGLLIGVLYLTLIADRVRAERAGLKTLPQRVLRYWLRLLLFVGLLAAFYAVLSVPFVIVLTIASFIHYVLALLVLLAGWIVSFWLLLYLLFVAYAIVISNDGVQRAMWNSANVVQRNLLSTFGLILLSNMIIAGTLLIWQQFELTWVGNVFAIVANAFVGSGLVAATFLFYQDRYRVWQQNLKQTAVSRQPSALR